MHAATIVARNYLPYARVLAESFLRHHPGARFTTLLLDGDEDDRRAAGIAGDLLLIDEIGLDAAQWHSMAAMYSVMEFATAVKPALLRTLVRAEAQTNDDAVVYLDPDIEVVAPFPEVFAAAREHGIALTPHVLQPMPRDGREPSEEVIRQSGIFNLGFLGVSGAAGAFLDWWHERLVTDAVVDIHSGLFTDQRWVDWVPALFPHVILRDPGLNVAYWNLHERTLTTTADGVILAGAAPLKFVHFSGYDATAPWRLSCHAGDHPRVQIGDQSALDQLCDRYGARLVDQGLGGVAPLYGYDISIGGMHLDPIVRKGFRQSVMAARVDHGAAPPDPFLAADIDAFVGWLDESVVGPTSARLSAWTVALYDDRPDLQQAFPDLAVADAYRFRHWLNHEPGAVALRRRIGLEPLDDGATRAEPSSQREVGGWNVVGYMNSEMGVGEAGRRITAAVEGLGIPTQMVSLNAGRTRNAHPTHLPIDRALRYVDSIYCVNADVVSAVSGALEHPERRRGDARRFGFWFWELAVFPEQFASSFELFDEIWAASEFTRDAIAAVSPVPVRLVPLPVVAPSRPTPFRREHVGLPTGFVFLNLFDFNSVVERKNPFDLIAVYCRTFGPDDGAHLVIKTSNGVGHPAEYARMLRAIAGRPDVHAIDGHVTADEVQAMIELSDSFVSLHRSEGFGLNLAAPMAAGRAVVATGYSGNMTFMDAGSAYLVPYTPVPVGPASAPYAPEVMWAQPDLQAAGNAMRSVFDDRDRALRVGEAGRMHVLERQSMARTAATLRPLLTGLAARQPSPDHFAGIGS